MKRGPWRFNSFFFAGFECSQQLTREGRRLDLIAATQHDVQAREDYLRCREVGLRAVREAARWPILDRGGVLNLQGVRELARLGRATGMLQIWDLMHYGYPDDLDPFSAQFVERFVAYARAVAEVVCEETLGPTYWTPVNEISYHAWAGAEVAYMAPFARGRGSEYKRALVRAAVAALNAIWEVDPRATMLSAEPLIHLHAPLERPDLQGEADHFNHQVVMEAFDLLAGRLEPELGGSRDHLGLVGLNYYWCNQWTIATVDQPQQFLTPDDPRYVPLSHLLGEVQARYGGPLVIAETGATVHRRPSWITYLGQEAQLALQHGVNLQGICWYPIVTSPDWEDTTAFFDGGLFDIAIRPDGCLERVLFPPAAVALRAAQADLDPEHRPSGPPVPALPTRSALPVRAARLSDHTRFKPDNFSYQTLLSEDSLVVELYGFEPGQSLPEHRHSATEHAFTVLAGTARVQVGEQFVELSPGDSVLAPAEEYHGIENTGTERLLMQQVSSPKPWDARFSGPFPSQLG
jgi:quercetin dioxygenase-like cupin family protein